MKKNVKSKIVKSSLVVTIGVSILSPIGIALYNNLKDRNVYKNFSITQDVDQISSLNKPETNMFYNTANIRPYTDTKNGPIVTPYGWIGTYSEPTGQNAGVNNNNYYWTGTLVHVGWDGSILWMAANSDLQIYSVKYNFSTNTLFVLRSQGKDGVGNGVAQYKIHLDIYDAVTGIRLYNTPLNSGWNFNDNVSGSDIDWGNEASEWKNYMYYSDIITLQNGDILFYYQPNAMNLRVNNSFLPSADNYQKYIRNNDKIPNIRLFYIKKSEIENKKKGQGNITIHALWSPFVQDFKLNWNRSDILMLSSPFLVADKSGNSEADFAIVAFGYHKTEKKVKYYNRSFNISFQNGNPTLPPLQNGNNDKVWLDVGNKMDVDERIAKSGNWNHQYLNANLRPNRNMFNDSIVTLAYPYATRYIDDPNSNVGNSEQNIFVPIFNVVQLDFSNDFRSDGSGSDNNISFDFGKKIVDYWKTNSSWNINPEDNISGQLYWNPWPFANRMVYDYVYSDQSYNRLISVSPFDGTIVYALRTNNVRKSKIYNTNTTLYTYRDLYDTRKADINNWASFWVGRTQGDLKGKVANILIDNNYSYFTKSIDRKMLNNSNIEDLYSNGFWFDPVNSENLYYRVTGTSYNTPLINNKIKSSPIGLIAQNLSYLDMSDLTNRKRVIDSGGAGNNISDKSYSNYITARVDLGKWYPRTWKNYKTGFNTYKSNDIVLNESQSNDVANKAKIVTDFGQKQTGDIFKTAKAVDMYSVWDVSNTNKDRLVVKGPKITSISSQDDINNRKVKLKLSLETNISNNTFLKEEDKIKAQVFEKTYEIVYYTLGYQFINSWGSNLKFNYTNNNELSVKLIGGNSDINHKEWGSGSNLGYFTSNSGNGNFIQINDYYNENNTRKNPLRVELQIDYNPNNLPEDNEYIKKLKLYNDGIFTKTYPIWTSNNNEKIFSDVFRQYVSWKAQNMNWLDPLLNKDTSPGNISIKAFVKLNPYWERNTSQGLVYNVDNTTQALFDNRSNTMYTYDDQYNESRYIYKQNSSEWENNYKYGFGEMIKDEIKNSWETLIPPKNIVSEITNKSDLKNDLVRALDDSNNIINVGEMFRATFNDDSSKIVLKLINDDHKAWVESRFKKYNQLLGRRVVFQYTTTSNQEWVNLETKYYDNDFKNIDWINKGFEVSLSGVADDIKSSIDYVRFILDPIDDNEGQDILKNKITDSSKVIDSSTDNNIFQAGKISIHKININVDYKKGDISLNIQTNNNNNYFNSATKEKIKTALQNIQSQYLNANNLDDNILNYIELKYSLDLDSNSSSTTWDNLDKIAEKIYNKLNNFSDLNQGGIVNLYDNTKNNQKEVTKIGVKFFLKDPNSVNFVKLNEIGWENEYKFIRKTSNKYLIDLSAYINHLKNSLIDFDKNNDQNGTITAIRIPNHSGNMGDSFLSGWTFEQMKNLFARFGISIQYQTIGDDWKDNLNDIKEYNTSNPKLKIKFKYDSNQQIDLTLNGTNYISSEEIIELSLNAPILIKLDNDTFNTFKNENPVTGNTYKIQVDKNKEWNFVEKIKEFSIKGTTIFPNPNPWDKIHDYLEIKYALGNPDDAIFYNSQEFINQYQNNRDVQYNNQVSVKIFLKEDGRGAFILDSSIENNNWILIDKNDAKFKIFIHGEKYQNELNNVQVRGSTSKLDIVLPPELQKIKNNEIEGLKIEFSLKPNINYDENNSDINNGWNANPPTSVTNQKILSIRIKNTEEKYLYGNQVGSPIKDVHRIDLTQITQLVDVNKNWFSEVELAIEEENKYLKDLKNTDITKWEDQIWANSSAITNNNELKEKLEIKYQIDGVNGIFNSSELVNKIKEMEKDYNSSSLGIVHLWNDSIGTKIYATFAAKDGINNIVFIHDINNPDDANNELTGVVNTKKIKTLIDLSSYITKMNQTKIDTDFVKGESSFSTISSFTPPTMDANGGFLGGKSYDEITSRLNQVGISFIYNDDDDSSQDTWVQKKDVKKYNKNKALLYLGFNFSESILTNNNIVLKIKNDSSDLVQNTYTQKDIVLTLDAPLELIIDNEELKPLQFKGNTKTINNGDEIKDKIKSILEKVKNTNKTNVANTLNKDLIDLNLEIRFSLNTIRLEEPSNKSIDGIWFTFDDLNSILSNSKTNYDSNKVLAKFYVKNNPKIKDFDKYHLSNKAPKVINEENKSTKTEFNIYINNVNETTKSWIWTNIKLYGSQENFTLTNYQQWLDKVPNGLSIQYNVIANNDNPDLNSWKDNFDEAKPINVARDYWIRFKVGDAYVFENALKDNVQFSEEIKLDASNIQVALKIKNEWLNQINLNGNLKDLTINDDQAIQKIKEANMMPIENIIQVEYTFNGSEWWTKNEFIQKLKDINNNIDSNKWFILREEVKGRFALNKQINESQNPKYILDIDGVNIDEDNSNNLGIELITTNLNNNVKGYINLDRFPEFIASTFKVKGTNIEAFLNIENVNKLNDKLKHYSSSDIFSILYKWDETMDYNEENRIWTPGQDLQEKMKLNGDYQKRYFGIQFKNKNSNYDLYKNNNKLDNNKYEITSPQIKVEISVEIENPLVGKAIVVKYLDGNNAIFYNHDGGFELTIDNKTFKDFINSTSLLQDQKDALELAYYVSENQISQEELIEIQKPENISKHDDSNEKYGKWKTLDTNTDWKTRDLKLKVNDYIVLALRIKKDKMTSETNQNGYVLKDNNHTPTNEKRVFGYKVHTNNIEVDWQSLKLRNVGLAENANYGLDGYAMLDQVQLKSAKNDDSTNDFLNVSLSLDFFNGFHLDSNNKVLVSASGARLVKRDSSGATSDGNYKDIDGNDIRDKDGNLVPILYTNKDQGILAPPSTESTKQRTHDLIEQSSNRYTLELNDNEENVLFSFFKNQEISITFKNKKGDAIENDMYDYYVDQDNVSKKYTITDLIKFPIANDKLVQYKFNSEEFNDFIKNPNNLNQVYQNSVDPTKNPINSQSKMIYTYKVVRTAGKEESRTLNTIQEIMDQIQTDFGQKVKLRTTYISVNGVNQDVTSNQLSNITSLQNGDRFKIEIVSSNENDLIFAQQPAPLIFTVNGLYEQDIDASILKFLRVEQSGQYEGQGSFNIYVDDPSTDRDNDIPLASYLQGYNFLVKVWNKEKTVKQDWTNDLGLITNLNNGDKVEWKLVAPSGAPIQNAYYNTIANMDKHDANNNQYSFIQVNKIGNNSTNIYQNGIGQNPENDNIYPENSGFIIDGLVEKPAQVIPQLTIEQFINIMNYMNFTYTGINGLGNMVSERNISNITVGTYKNSRETFTLKDLIDREIITFYANNNRFNWTQIRDKNGNWIVAPGNLLNGDQITVHYQDSTMASYYEWQAPTVSGLKEKNDNMSLLMYVGIGMASLVTLGVFGLVYIMARNKKLRNKK